MLTAETGSFTFSLGRQAGRKMIDPVCLVHGKRLSEHYCLYCCLCFKSLTVEECHITEDGTRENVCNECADHELKTGYWMIRNCLRQILERSI